MDFATIFVFPSPTFLEKCQVDSFSRIFCWADDKMKRFLIVASLLLLTLLQIHNVLSFPVSRGFDAIDHAQYINFVKTKQAIPLASQGWEMYQPPAYYFLASLFPTIAAVQWLGLGAWIIMIISAVVLSGSWLAAPLIGALPILIYLTPAIGNELFSAAIISVTLVYYLRGKKPLVLGLLLSLAIISKATAWVLIIGIILDQIGNLKKIFWPFVIMFLAGSWFYIRNIVYFGNPFISPMDLARFHFWQEPGFRDLRFFTDLSGFWHLDLFRSQHYSLWAGTFFSWFYDGHNVIIPVQPFSLAGAVLAIASLPLLVLAFKGSRQGMARKEIPNPGGLFRVTFWSLHSVQF